MMRRTLGTLLLLAALAACGSDDGATDDGPSEGGPGGADPGFTQVAMLTESAAGGEVGGAATPLPDQDAVAAFTRSLDDPLVTQVSDTVAQTEVPEGQELYGAVVSLDCTPPTEVIVTRPGPDDPDGEVRIEAKAVKPSPEVQCLVPVTTVALVLVDVP